MVNSTRETAMEIRARLVQAATTINEEELKEELK